jgi:hypothetical protein
MLDALLSTNICSSGLMHLGLFAAAMTFLVFVWVVLYLVILRSVRGPKNRPPQNLSIAPYADLGNRFK